MMRGTWRRIRVVEFESKFVDNPSTDPKDNEFKKDKSLLKNLKHGHQYLLLCLLKLLMRQVVL